MAITASAKKGIRQGARRRAMNLQKKKKIKTLVKEVKLLIGQKKTEEAKILLPQIYKALDKAAKKKCLKKNTASRKKSRIAKMLDKAVKA